MKENIFQTASHIQKIATLVDGGFKLDIITQELSPEEATKLFSLKNKMGWLLFKETEIKLEDIEIPEIKGEFKSDKTPSARLRSVLYVFWKQQSSKKSFDDFYKGQMEKFILKVKEKLE